MAMSVRIPWWQWLPIWSWRVVEIVESADEVSIRLPRNGAAFVGSAAAPKWIAFDCPCRSGHRIMINADSKRKPVWQLGAKPEYRLTISPSIDYTDGARRCHYFVRGGKILWAKDTVR